MNQPNRPPTLLVPRHCILKSNSKHTKVVITDHVVPMASKAPSMLIGGVMIPSAARRAAAQMTRKLTSEPATIRPVYPLSRLHKAKVPPSPRWSARMIIKSYFTVRNSKAQMMRLKPPRISLLVSRSPPDFPSS